MFGQKTLVTDSVVFFTSLPIAYVGSKALEGVSIFLQSVFAFSTEQTIHIVE